jgi:putative transposase
MAALLVVPGAIINASGKAYCIKKFETANSVRVQEIATGYECVMSLSEITQSSTVSQSVPRQDLEAITAYEWDEAIRRYRIIKPLFQETSDIVSAVNKVADQESISVATIYRWISRFRATGTVSSLLRVRRKDTGMTRLNPEIEQLLGATIEDSFLTNQKLNIVRAHRNLVLRCRQIGIDPPHVNTFRKRVLELSPERVMRKREGNSAAHRFRPILGKFPGADFPYSVIQLDHTIVDIELVDEIHRIVVGRPYITVAIDVFSRMIAGYYISFDPPGMLATGICIANAILSKEKHLASFGLTYDWPCQGLPSIIHVDNAKEFRGDTLGKACNEYGIDLKFRKIKTPNYGGHIERMLGTLLKEIHALPGTTFSNPTQKGEYDSSKHATMTIREFEEWFLNLICGAHHNRQHSELCMPPIRKYEEGIVGSDERPAVGKVQVCTDEERLRIDFLPMELRTIQPYGVMLDNIVYYGEVLNRWIGAKESENLRSKRKFIIRRDPRDISYVLFYDPDACRYFRLSYQNAAFPPISLWELRAVQKWLTAQGRKKVNQEEIFAAYEQMRKIEDQAKTLTRKTRMLQERRRHHRKSQKSGDPVTVSPVPTVVDPTQVQIVPFDEVEDI